MSSEAEVRIRELLAADLDAVLELWSLTEGLGLNESDTLEALETFLRRNPGLSAIAVSTDGRLIGAVLCGHDGRRGTIHLAVSRPYRRQGVAKRLLEHCLWRLEQAQIPRCNVFLLHRAIQSLMEEIQAVDWYSQRADVCKDESLKAILAHNRDEEKEHAAMLHEWIRRKDATFSKQLKDYLFTEKPIAKLESQRKS